MKYRHLLFQIIKNNQYLHVYINNITNKTNITNLSTKKLENLIFQYFDSSSYSNELNLSELEYQIHTAEHNLICNTYSEADALYSLLKIEWAENRLARNCYKKLIEPHIHYERK